MYEEQRMILRMLEEGKITAAEAETLLKALSDSPKTAKPESEPPEDPWVRLEKLGDDFASKVEMASKRFSRSLEHNVGDKLSKLPKVLARFPFFGSEESHEFSSITKGTVGPGEVIAVKIQNPNGSVRVAGWAEETYRLKIIQRLRGGDREVLSTRLFDLGWEEGAERKDFHIVLPPFSELGISLHLMIPENRMYEFELQAQNGSLLVENLKGTNLHMEHVNGSARLKAVKAHTIRGEGGNGSCEMQEVEANLIRYRLGNGSYRVAVSAANVDFLTANGSVNVRVTNVQGVTSYKLRTTNGAIRVTLPSQSDLGLALDLQTAVGRISTDLTALEITRQERQGGGALLGAHSLDYSGKVDKLDLEAASTSGSIRLSTRDD
ncbi:MAG TPA: DUF4097 family beta strand repeat-containing protein [Limnochordia bacterium]|nr:DUF4097 family beta strand repeat-containing protein [Limnochordia bacterium]